MAMDLAAAKQRLVDLRVKYTTEADQNLALTRQLPPEYSIAALNKAGLNGHKYEHREFASLDAAIVVLRHLFAHVAEKWRNVEDTSPLQPLIWADLNRSPNDALTVVRYHILEEVQASLSSEQTRGPAQKALAYEQITENADMYTTIWARPEFMLWHHDVYERRFVSEKWTQVEYKVPERLARMGCIYYNGELSLGDRISSHYGKDTSREQEVDVHWQSNRPAVIRVLYDNTEPESISKTFDELSSITVDGQRLLEKDNKDGYPCLVLKPAARDPMKYQLIAMVRLADKTEKLDRVRLYRIDGHPILQQPELVRRFVGTNWNLGDRARYMLYYTPELPDRPPGGRLPREFARFGHRAMADVRKEAMLWAQPSGSQAPQGQPKKYGLWEHLAEKVAWESGSW